MEFQRTPSSGANHAELYHQVSVTPLDSSRLF
jgi:hypothetical protein